MSPVRNQIIAMLDSLTDDQQRLIFELITQFSPNIDIDDIATEEDIRDINKALEEYANGETVNFEDVDWD